MLFDFLKIDGGLPFQSRFALYVFPAHTGLFCALEKHFLS